MSEIKYPNLFKPLVLGNMVLRNRIIAAPTGYVDVDMEGWPARNAADYYEFKARGGAAVVIFGESTLDDVSGRGGMRMVNISSSECIPSISVIADGITKHGAIASAELAHPGMFASGSYLAGNPALGPLRKEIIGALASGSLKNAFSTEMTQADILRCVELFGAAALRVKQAGFRMALVHGAHGWLLAQFMSPKLNTRTDKWGGPDIENRMRFPIAVCQRIKEECGKDFLIDFRMSGSEESPEGYTIKDSVEMAVALDDYVDLIHVSAGHHEVYSAFVRLCPSMFHEDALNLKYAAEIKKHVKSPVVTVGGFNDPSQMEEVIASGKADAIALGRALIADPDVPLKARLGKEKDINHCLRCYTCYSSVVNTKQFYCAINPAAGRETENKAILPPVTKKKVLVAGGGIGGMQAALTAADRGHDVIICEKTDKLGGVLNCETEVTFKRKLDLYIKNQARRVHENPSIEVRTNTTVTEDLAREIAPDAIVAALGSRPLMPVFIKGFDRANVFGAQEIYNDISKAGQNVVILGGGLVGAELAIHLNENGRQVTIIEMLPMINVGSNIIHGQALDIKLSSTDIKIVLSTKALEITEEGVVAENANGQIMFKADTVIYAIGQRSVRDGIDKLCLCAPEFYQIGDCNTPATIAQAVREAYYAARDIGRI